jgi:acetylornithine deacetylase/succinyl-diaminopimelate desuccinylase-like protein
LSGPGRFGSDIHAVIRHVDCRIDEAIERMIAMRRFRSAVTERAGMAEHRACAEWFVEELRGIGFTASARDTPGRPIAVGHDRGSPGPSVLFCGHYETWPSGLLRGNGGDESAASAAARAIHHCSSDQSMQLMAFVEACRAWKAVAGRLPMAVSVLVEGDGWPGSVGLRSFLHMYADELKADIGLAPAARIWCCAIPAINSMLRGVCCEQITIAVDGDQPARPGRGAAAADDPIRILVRILGDLHDPSGRVTIPGFYAGIDAPLRPSYVRESGTPPDSDPMSAGPVCEIDIVSASRTDAGWRVTSPRAVAKLSFHLVCDQDPDVISRAFRDFAHARIPPGTRIEFGSECSAPPVRFTETSPAFRKVQEALTSEWERQATFICGDAEPAIHALREALGMEVIVTSFPEQQHGCRNPRDSADLANYRVGVRSWARILDALTR